MRTDFDSGGDPTKMISTTMRSTTMRSTTLRRGQRQHSKVFPYLLLCAAVVAGAGAKPTLAQDAASKEAATKDAAAADNAASAVADSMPKPTFTDQEHADQYKTAVELLGKQAYKAAQDIFRRLKSKAESGEPRDAALKGYTEASGGVEYLKAQKLADDEKYRKALAKVKKSRKKYKDATIDAVLKALEEELLEQLFLLVADFEEAGGNDEDEDEESEGEDERRPRRLGQTGYGTNTSIAKGEPKEGRVRSGKAALSWRTTRDLTALEFDKVNSNAAEYRYLNISLRSETPKAKPKLIIMLDCDENALGGQGGGRRGRGRRGGAWIYQRSAFTHSLTPSNQWQDLRLDLKKFAAKGDILLEDVVKLRIIHMPGTDARILIDEIKLEKE